MTKARPGLKKRAPRPAPHCQRELHALMCADPIAGVASVARGRSSLSSRFTRWVRSIGSRLLRFRQGRA